MMLMPGNIILNQQVQHEQTVIEPITGTQIELMFDAETTRRKNKITGNM